MSGRENRLFNLLLKLGISSKKLLEDTQKIIEQLHKSQGEERLQFFHKLILLGSLKQRSPQDFMMLRNALDILQHVQFLRKRGYEQIATDLEREAWNTVFTLSLKWSPSFAKRLFLSDDLFGDFYEYD